MVGTRSQPPPTLPDISDDDDDDDDDDDEQLKGRVLYFIVSFWNFVTRDECL